MLRNCSAMMGLGAILLGVVTVYSPYASSEALTLVGQVPIKSGAASLIHFSSSGDKAIIEWPKPRLAQVGAWVLDASSERLSTTRLSGPRAIWGSEGPIMLSNGSAPSVDTFSTQFNTDKARAGTKEGGITLVDENGKILCPDWNSRPIQGSLPRGEQPAEIVAIVGEIEYSIMDSGDRYPTKVTLDPILNRILLHGREGRELISISEKELKRTHLPDVYHYTLIPGQDFLIAMALLGGDDHGREPDSVTLHIADTHGKLLEELPVAVDYSDFSVSDIIVRSSSKLVLVTTREYVYAFKIVNR